MAEDTIAGVFMRRWRYAVAIIGLGIVVAWLIPQSLRDQLQYPGSKIESLREEKGLLRLRSLSQAPAEVVHSYYRQRYEGRDGWIAEFITPAQMRFHRTRGKVRLENWFEDTLDIAIMTHRDGTRIFISYDTREQCAGLC
jgi:hypothetical protein